MTRPLGLLALTILLSTVAQVFLKMGANELEIGSSHINLSLLLSLAIKMLTTPMILLGLVLFGASAILWILILTKAELSYAFPLLSLGYVLMLIPAWALFNEDISLNRLIGTLLICGGVYFISR